MFGSNNQQNEERPTGISAAANMNVGFNEADNLEKELNKTDAAENAQPSSGANAAGAAATEADSVRAAASAAEAFKNNQESYPGQGSVLEKFINRNQRPVNYDEQVENQSSGSWREGIKSNSTRGIIIAILVIVVIVTFYKQFFASGITKSTIERTKIASAVSETVFYEDPTGTFMQDESNIDNGAMKFHEETGIWPFVYILEDNAFADQAAYDADAAARYKSRFSDEVHLLVEISATDTGYMYGIAAGTEALKVMDEEAQTILTDYLTKYLTSNSDNEYSVYNALVSSSERIMSTRNITTKDIVVMVIAAAVLAGLIYYYLRSVKKGKESADEAARR